MKQVWLSGNGGSGDDQDDDANAKCSFISYRNRCVVVDLWLGYYKNFGAEKGTDHSNKNSTRAAADYKKLYNNEL